MERPPLATRPRADDAVSVQPSTLAPSASRSKRACSKGTTVLVATWPRAAPKAIAHASATARRGSRSPAQRVHLSQRARRARGSLALRNQLSTCPWRARAGS
jgi:hypothetical protein